MNVIEKYIELQKMGSEIECIFKINRLGSIMLLDGNVKVILDEKMDMREAEKYIDQSIMVNVNRVDQNSNTVYVTRVKSLSEKIHDTIDRGEKFRSKGTIVRVAKHYAYIDIEDSGIVGVITAQTWRKNAWIRNLHEKCSVGDVIEFCIVGINTKQGEMDAEWKLSREDITTDPWDLLMDDVWVEDATINVECVDIPKGKTYWWGKCDEIEDLELVCDFSSVFDVQISGVYRCKIRNIDKQRRFFAVTPFAEIDNQEDTRDAVVENKEESENEANQEDSFERFENSESVIVAILDALNSSGEVKKSVNRVLEDNQLTNEQQIYCLNRVIGILLANSKTELAHSVLRKFSSQFSINPQMYCGLIVQMVGQFKRKGDLDSVDTLYSELLLFLKMKISSLEPKAFIGTINSAINFYADEERYADVIKFLSIYISKISPKDETYNFENSRLYFYRGMMQKSKGNYASAKSELYLCLKYANKKKSKDDYNKYIGMAVAEMKKCDALFAETKKQPKSDEDIIDDYYKKLDYEEAYQYALRLYSDNQDNLDIVELYEKTKKIYEKSQIRMATLPLENKKGKYYRLAYAAETIEDNLERAEELWLKSIEEKEPGRSYSINAYINVLCKEGKYYDALGGLEKYQSYFQDIVEVYLFRTKVVDVYKKLGAYEEAVFEGIKIAKKYSENKKFIEAGGLKRLASLYQSIAYLQTKQFGLYESANSLLDQAKECGMDAKVYAPAYINNCIMMGQNDRAYAILDEYEEYLSDEFISSVKKSLSLQNDTANESGITSLEQGFIQNNELFFDWYIETQIEGCTEDIKTYFEMEEFRTVESIREYISKYDNFDTNLKAQMYLNIIAGKYVIDTLDGYASNDYYSFIASALNNDIEIRNRTNRQNIVLFKYLLIALYESKNENQIKVILETVIKDISYEKDHNTLKKYIAVLFNNNPILKSLDNWITDNILMLLQDITEKTTLVDIKKCIEEILSEYTDRQNQIVENKNLLNNYIESDLREADTVLVEVLGNTAVLIQEDRTYLNKIIEINRTLIGIAKLKDYLSIDAILDKSSDMIKNARINMEDGVTPLCLSIWFDILNSYEDFIVDERNKIEVTLSSRLSVSIDNTSLFTSNGRVTVTYSIKNAENCALAKDIHITFMDTNGVRLVSDDVVIDKLMGGESQSLEQEISAEKTFSLVMAVSYKDNVGVIKKIELSESIFVNKETSFVNIHNPFTITTFDQKENPNMIFVGRDELISNLKTQLLDKSIRCAVLYGQKRTGKSSIFNKLSIELADNFVVAKVLMSNISSMDKFYKAVARSFKREEKRDDIATQIRALADPTDNFDFEDYLEAIRDIYGGKRVLLLLDEFSHLYDLRDTEFPEQFMNAWKEMIEYNLFSAVITGQETLGDLIKKFPNQFAVQYTVPVEYIPYRYFRDLVDKPIHDSNGSSRFEENSFEIFWQLTKGHPYLSQILGGKIVEYLNSCKMERIYDATINKVVEEYIRTATERDFDSFYCKFSKNEGEYSTEVNATLRLLIKIAEECSYNGNYSCDISRVAMTREEEAIKADLVRRGVLVIDDNRCEIYVRLFYEWLRNKGKNIYSMQESYVEAVSETQQQKKRSSDIVPIVNNYISGNINQITGDVNQVQGDLIKNQVNNVTVSIENAVLGLENLQQMIDNPTNGIATSDVQKQIEGVKFNPEIWDSLSDDEKEEKTEEYAERVFRSDAFINKELTEDQKTRFGLTNKTLAMLSSDCKKQITCGIQVYDLIQYCIDNFGLEMTGLESPRAILFARAFERHMKDCMYKAFSIIDSFSSQVLKLGSKMVSISDYPINRTTIGNYTTMLSYKNSYKVLEKYAFENLGYSNKDDEWWNCIITNLKSIGLLRNECCHSGSSFDSAQLTELIRLIFNEKSLDAVYIVQEIYNHMTMSDNSIKLKKEEVDNKTHDLTTKQIENLDKKLIGKKANFIMKERTSRKSIRGFVNGKYPASMSPNEAKKIGYGKDAKIQVLVDSIQDGKYVVRIP